MLKFALNKIIFLILFLGLIYILLNNFKSANGSGRSVSKPKIFCIILAKEENLVSKAKLVYNKWASKCDNHSFISSIPGLPMLGERAQIKFDNFINVL